jgi:xanthine dehydrogenase accessory factor
MERKKNIYAELIRRLDDKERLAVATIIAARGATPQIPGAAALFSETALLLGTLGGGVVEAGAQGRAVRCLRSGGSIYYEVPLQGDGSSAEEAVCGGSVSILIDGSPRDHDRTWKDLRNSLDSRRAGILATRIDLNSDGTATVIRHWTKGPEASEFIDNNILAISPRTLEEVFRERAPRLLEKSGKKKTGKQTLYFLEPIFPLSRLLIVGAGHIGQAVAYLGTRLDFEVTVIDDRAEYANRERFPEVDAVIVAGIGQAVRDFPIFSDTFIVIVTRGHSHDADALRACIHSPAAYIGMIGSRHKVALMRERFLARGWASASEFNHVRSPIGLPIGSKTVEEIAVSIAAELVQVRSSIGPNKSEASR